jgi:hypothetical protein
MAKKHRSKSLRHKHGKTRSRTHRSKTRSRTRRSTTRRRRYSMRGGNYETDITTRTLEGTATKPLNKIVVALPGYGTMSGSAYVRLMEDIDRNGNDMYD